MQGRRRSYRPRLLSVEDNVIHSANHPKWSVAAPHTNTSVQSQPAPPPRRVVQVLPPLLSCLLMTVSFLEAFFRCVSVFCGYGYIFFVLNVSVNGDVFGDTVTAQVRR
ncbi:hypothetical protein HN51_032302 [Arachis hypogaea]